MNCPACALAMSRRLHERHYQCACGSIFIPAEAVGSREKGHVADPSPLVRKREGGGVIMIQKTAQSLRKGQRVKLRHTTKMWKCVTTCEESADGYACVAIGYHKQWLSPGFKVQIPIEDDVVLGGAVKP